MAETSIWHLDSYVPAELVTLVVVGTSPVRTYSRRLPNLFDT
ncbi:hypothetical protein [Nocardia sp. CNY236]|nr:hypothetical protein [Nocardia sp. CNY236]